MMSNDAVRIILNECMQKYDEYSERFLPCCLCLKESCVRMVYERRFDCFPSYICPKCGKPMELRERTGKSLNDGFEWLCRNRSSVKEENHYVSRSVRKGSWFQLSYMDMCTVLLVMRKWFEVSAPHRNMQSQTWVLVHTRLSIGIISVGKYAYMF
ncbi:uncharacterized protein TNCV_4096061 [Trichonephila clavipes]|nr:uncharacterized protein TNCV_4096061 [Trichonephila clavipes]